MAISIEYTWKLTELHLIKSGGVTLVTPSRKKYITKTCIFMNP